MVALEVFFLLMLIGGGLSSTELHVPDKNGTLSLYTRGDVKLPCKVTPSTTTSVKWEHIYSHYPPFSIYINGQIDEKLRHRFSIYNASVGDYSLKILHIQDFDTGRYRCFNQQQLIKTYDIDVLVRPPTYKEHTTVEGQFYTIPCNTTVDADVRWIYNSSVTRFRSMVYDHGLFLGRFKRRFSLNTSVPLLYGLDISSVRLNDAGNYTCIDDVGQGDEHIHSLIVQVRPPIYEEHTAVEGQSYIIPCDTIVIANVSWFF